MKFFWIAIRGLLDFKKPEDLAGYFYQQWKEAEEKEFYEVEEFFDGLSRVPALWEMPGVAPPTISDACDMYYDKYIGPKSNLKEFAFKHRGWILEQGSSELNQHKKRELSDQGLRLLKKAINQARQKAQNLPPGQPGQAPPVKRTKEDPETFEGMFVKQDLIPDCLYILKLVNPPIINSDNHFNLGPRSKGAITAWLEALKQTGIIKKNLKDEVVAQLLNSKIHGLNLYEDGRTLRNYRTTAYTKYYTTLLNYFQDLPLST